MKMLLLYSMRHGLHARYNAYCFIMLQEFQRTGWCQQACRKLNKTVGLKIDFRSATAQKEKLAS